MYWFYSYLLVGVVFMAFSFIAQTLAPRRQLFSHLLSGLLWPVLLLVAPADLLGITKFKDAKIESRRRKEDSDWIRNLERSFSSISRSLTQLSPFDRTKVQECLKDISLGDVLSFNRLEALEIALNRFWNGGLTLAAAYDSDQKLKQEIIHQGLNFNYSAPDLMVEFPRSFSRHLSDLPENGREALWTAIQVLNRSLSEGENDVWILKVWGSDSLTIYPVGNLAMVITPDKTHSRIYLLAVLNENPYAAPAG